MIKLLCYFYTCIGVCAARCMIDYARLSDLESPDCDIDMSSATAPSLPAHDNDKSGSVEEKEDWIDQLVIVCTAHIILTHTCVLQTVCVCVDKSSWGKAPPPPSSSCVCLCLLACLPGWSSLIIRFRSIAILNNNIRKHVTVRLCPLNVLHSS